MTSIYRHVLGAEFDRLHPQIQRRFGFSSTAGVAAIGRGIMDEIWKGRFFTLPFLYVGTWRHIMFPETGRNIPFTMRLSIASGARLCRGFAGSSPAGRAGSTHT